MCVGQVNEDCGGLENRGAIRQHQRRHLSGRIDAAERLELGGSPADPQQLIRRADLFEDDLHGQRPGVRPAVKLVSAAAHMVLSRPKLQVLSETVVASSVRTLLGRLRRHAALHSWQGIYRLHANIDRRSTKATSNGTAVSRRRKLRQSQPYACLIPAPAQERSRKRSLAGKARPAGQEAVKGA